MAMTRAKASQVTAKLAATGSTVRGLDDKLAEFVSVKDFGAVGDDSDETTKLTNALTAAAGNTLWLEPGKVYRSTTALVVPANTTLELNGSKIKFVITGSSKGLDPRSGTTIRNGAIEVAGSAFAGHGGHGCPIVIGDYNTGAGYKNILIENLEITTNKSNGNGIFVVGDSHDIVVRNITFPASALLGRPLATHWGNADTPAAGTTHPYNVVFSNIKVGALSGNLVDVAAVLVSSSYNITVENLDVDSIQYGRAIYVYAGDYGNQYAGAVANSLLRGLRFKNIQSRANLGGVFCNGNNIIGPVVTAKSEATVEDSVFVGFDATIATCYGAQFTNTDGFNFRNCVFQAHQNNAFFNGVCQNIVFDSCRIASSYARGVSFNSGVSNLYTNVTFANCLFDTNNTQTSAGRADVWADYCRNLRLVNNQFISPNMSYSVRVINTTENVLLLGNHVVSVAGGGVGFSIGSSTDYTINVHGSGNTAASGVTLAAGAPVFVNRPSGKKEFNATAAPVSGTWAVGDTVWNTATAAGGAPGWICTTAGTPGTWKAMASVAA